jgi:lipopolysaccharide/colanic/teichoic acid biosynthesis glycosyltransferase
VESAFFSGKDLLDRILALILLVPAAPLIAMLIVIVRLTSRGSGIFRQVRVGKGGRIFTMYKLRSMSVDAEAGTGPTWAAAGADPRVTKVGYWLRVLHLDELPQLVNVAKGEMSLVGPRPERPEFVTILAEQIPSYLHRLVVKPGVTGLAQINLPPDTDLDSVRRKLMLDSEYIASANLLLDLRILACTAARMFGLRGGRAVRLFGLTRSVELPASSSSSSSIRIGSSPRIVAPLPQGTAGRCDGRQVDSSAEPSAVEA